MDSKYVRETCPCYIKIFLRVQSTLCSTLPLHVFAWLSAKGWTCMMF